MEGCLRAPSTAWGLLPRRSAPPSSPPSLHHAPARSPRRRDVDGRRPPHDRDPATRFRLPPPEPNPPFPRQEESEPPLRCPRDACHPPFPSGFVLSRFSASMCSRPPHLRFCILRWIWTDCVVWLRAGGRGPQRRQLREEGRTQRRIHWYVCLLHASISIHPALSFFECSGS
jgi:hypothetical protein